MGERYDRWQPGPKYVEERRSGRNWGAAMANRLIYKSTSAEFLDLFFGGVNAATLTAAYQRALDILDSIGDGPLSAAAAQLVDTGELEEDAVPNSESGWREGRVADRIIRSAYLEAIRLAQARDEPVPIETLWMTGASDELELHICEGPRQITVVFLIPSERDYGSRRAGNRSFVVCAREPQDGDVVLDADGPPVVVRQVSGGLSPA